MTSRGVDGPRELQFSIDDRRRVLRAADISAALGLRIPPANAEGYRDWAHPPHREMVRSLARDTTAGPVFYRRQLPPQMLPIDHLFQTSLFPLELRAAEGSHLGGSLPDLGGILVQSL